MSWELMDKNGWKGCQGMSRVSWCVGGRREVSCTPSYLILWQGSSSESAIPHSCWFSTFNALCCVYTSLIWTCLINIKLDSQFCEKVETLAIYWRWKLIKREISLWRNASHSENLILKFSLRDYLTNPPGPINLSSQRSVLSNSTKSWGWRDGIWAALEAASCESVLHAWLTLVRYRSGNNRRPGKNCLHFKNTASDWWSTV